MTIPPYHEPGPGFFCPVCKKDTPHYLRANGKAAVCIACSRGEDRPVKQLVQALPALSGGSEKRV